MYVKINEENKVLSYLNYDGERKYKKSKKKDPSVIEILDNKIPSIGAYFNQEKNKFSSYSYDYSKRGEKRKILKGLLNQYKEADIKPVDITAPFFDTRPNDSIEELDFWDSEKNYSKNDIVQYGDVDYIDWMEVNNVNRFIIDKEFFQTGRQSLRIIDRKQSCGGMDIPYSKMNIKAGGKYSISVVFSPTGERGPNPEHSDKDIKYWGIYMQCMIAFGRGEMFEFNYDDTYRLKAISTGATPPGEWEEVTFELDLTDVDELTGVMRIQTCNGSNPLADFYIDEIKVEDIKEEDIVYDLKFEMHSYRSRKKNVNKNPAENLELWQKIEGEI